ncbi:MAG: anti-sigma factor antagonist [Gammaproteobacteria bacterium]|nr:anti-sigma factor antagonist [Gammaproteobacteria bacterium]
MEYKIRNEGDFTVVALSGEVDLHYSPEARKQILAQLNKNNNVLVDLSGVSYIDSSGIASLVEGFQLARNKKLQFGLVGVSAAARQVLQLARLDKVFLIKDSIQDFITS